MLVAGLLVVLSAPARAADPATPARGVHVSPADSAARAALPRTAPYKVMLRSAVVPGWGQMYNHRPLKAALVVGGEGYLISRVFHELNLQNEAAERRAEAIAAGDHVADSIATYEGNLHRDKKIGWIWWTMAAHLLQMADAYVDAHLAPFAAGFREEDRASALLREDGLVTSAPPLPRDPALTLAVRVRF